MTSNMYMYMPIKNKINIMSIKGGLHANSGGLYFIVAFMGLTETKLG